MIDPDMNQTTSTWRVSIPRQQSSLTLRDLLCLATGLVDGARSGGGWGRCFCRPTEIVVEIVGLTGEEIDDNIDRFASNALSGPNKCLFIRAEIPVPSAPPDAPIQAGEYLRSKLTKKLLNSLPVGAILVSNVFDSACHPVFCEPVGEPRERDDVWAAAKAVGANNRMVEVVWDPADAAELCLLPDSALPPARGSL